MTRSRRGLLLGVGAYLLWGLFPLYWPLLEPAGALEILANRVVWSLFVVAILVLTTRRADAVRAVLTDHRRSSYVVVGAIVIAVNWGTYIWGVNNDRVIETSLGYFINPLVTVMFAVVLLGERLRPVQWVALGLALVAVVELTIDYGRPPYIALVLAFSFGTYGLMKKKADIGAVEGLTLETLTLAPLALVFMAVLQVRGDATLGHAGVANVLLLAGTGLITAIPLLLFGGAAISVSLTTIGLIQYLAPILQFLLGVIVFHESMPPARWIGFVLVWLALAIITVEALAHHRTVLRIAAQTG